METTRTTTSGGASRPAIPNEQGMMTGLFKDRDSAIAAYESLKSRGYTDDDINVVMSEDTRKQHFSGGSGVQTEIGNKAAKGAGVGGALGGTVGAVAAGIAAVGTSIAIPGLGLVVAGPIAAALAGAGAGGAAGSILGALVGAGIPEERVKHYEGGLKQGGVLIGVRPRSSADAEYLRQQWTERRGEHVYM
ncbi:MAG: general stress protein [Steroidobacteraceae bacterium]|jgi:hypothetical protein|nr:general stress protein [Steroidobacteraceae bacterium]